MPRKRGLRCHEETEQAQEVKAVEQVEARGEVAADAVKVVALPQGLAEIAFAPSAAKDPPTRPELLALSRNVPSAGKP